MSMEKDWFKKWIIIYLFMIIFVQFEELFSKNE